MPQLLSLVIPVFNEEANLPILYNQLLTTLKTLGSNFDYELIFINDGSTDHSQAIITSFANQNPRVYFQEFSRNFGKEAATSAGLRATTGAAAIVLDADLQHPPKLIPELIAKWHAGADMVIGVRRSNRAESHLKNLLSNLFYNLINSVAETKITPRGTDYRLINRPALDAFNRLTEVDRMTRGLLDWIGFKRDFVYFDAAARQAGSRRYSYSKLFHLAISALVANSLFPLKIVSRLGVFITITAGSLGLFVLIERYFLHDPWNLSFSGPAILAVIILFLVGILLTSQGLLGLYIASIHKEVLHRPMYVIRNTNKK